MNRTTIRNTNYSSDNLYFVANSAESVNLRSHIANSFGISTCKVEIFSSTLHGLAFLRINAAAVTSLKSLRNLKVLECNERFFEIFLGQSPAKIDEKYSILYSWVASVEKEYRYALLEELKYEQSF